MDSSETSTKMNEQDERWVAVGDSATLALVLGVKDEYRRLLESAFDASIIARDNVIHIRGRYPDVERLAELLRHMVAVIESGGSVTQSDIRYLIRSALSGESIAEAVQGLADCIVITERGQKIVPKTKGQREYVEAVQKNDLVFAIGPAGTGKTYLAMAMAIAALQRRQVSRLVLARPAVEAGEKLGYLPGNIEEKVDPYLRPLYDALYDILGMQKCQRHLERRIIEVIPLAYMRGRTFNDSFIVLDEAQNATVLQMKMFLTRMGYGSKAIVTGDITQIDLPHGVRSGLVAIQEILKGVPGVAFVYLTDKDVVRHPLVQRIVLAFEAWEHAERMRMESNESENLRKRSVRRIQSRHEVTGSDEVERGEVET
ncbi:MAG: PhoH family protein [Armatimonadota bacterium]|nr:PhoH family protein [Armatimonadota bacterium]MCX7777515.1 PhoH family protein [Armatimonadota bacterium]MDW8025991.1 PhoH family protein [Armatimonadota bacterium]